MVKAACFPIKDTITATKTEALMRELVEHGLIVVYEVEGKPYLQMCKWDNVPRAKESKYPTHEHDCTQMYTDVCNTHTDVPLTVTKTETKTKTETVVTPIGVSESVWQDFVNHRKAKKTQVTQTVIDGIQREATKAGWSLESALAECVIRGWQSFKADWVKDKDLSKTGQTNQSVMSGLTRGLVGGGQNVRLLGN
jgi:hypothetical protein